MRGTVGAAGVPAGDERPWAIRRLQSLPRRRRILIAVVTVGVILVAGVTDGLSTSPAPVQHVSDQGPAPAFSLPSVKDPARTVSLARYAGRPVILNFWGSWCAPCRREMPLLARTADRVGSRIQFLGVDLEDAQRSSAVSMMDRYKTPYPSGYDPNDSVANAYRLVGTPTTFFINAKGHVIGKVQGELDQQVLAFWVKTLAPGAP